MVRKSNWANEIIRMAYYLVIFILVMLIIYFVAMIFSAEADFSMEHAGNKLALSYSGLMGLGIEVDWYSMYVLANASHAKTFMLIGVVVHAIPTFLVLLYGIGIFKTMYDNYLVNARPFVYEDVDKLSLLSKLVLAIALIQKPLLSLLYSIPLGHFSVFINIDIVALVMAGILYLMSEIIKHGCFLQEEYDMTL